MEYKSKSSFSMERDTFPHSKVVYIIHLFFVGILSHPSDASSARSP